MTKPLTITHTWELEDDRYCGECPFIYPTGDGDDCALFGPEMPTYLVSDYSREDGHNYCRANQCIEKFGMGESIKTVDIAIVATAGDGTHTLN